MKQHTPQMEKAMFQLSEKLRHPSDLQVKLRNVWRQVQDLREEHRQNLTKMISRCHSNISRMSNGVSKLDEHLKNFVKDKNRNVDILKNFFGLVKDYKQVKVVCLAHFNLCQVIEYTEKLKAIKNPVESQDIIEYHKKVYEAEDFGCLLRMYNTDMSRNDHVEVSKALNVIERNSLNFTAKILEISENFVENHEVMGDVSRVVGIEEARDSLTMRAKEGETSEDPILREMHRIHKMYVTRKPKLLKAKVVKAIQVSVKNKFDRLRQEEIFMNKMGFVLDDLEFINDNIELDFYSFDEILVLYNRNLKQFLDENTERLDAGEVLAIIEYVGNYYNSIESKFNRMATALGERLLGNEAELLERYTGVAQKKLQEWITNITRLEVEKFFSRKEEPSRDEEDRLISPGFVSLLQIIRMQLEPITFNKRIFTRVTQTVVKCCEELKRELVSAMEKDFKPSCEIRSRAGYEDFCIMFGNSGIKVAQYITSLPQCQDEDVKELGNVFISILKASNKLLSGFIIHSCKPAIDKIFTEEWYHGNVIKVIVLTLKDFLDDYQSTMSEYSFVTFVHELSSSISATYMKQLERNRATITESCSKILKSDHTRLVETLNGYGDEEDVKLCLSPMLRMIPLMDSRNDDLFVIELNALKMVFPNVRRSLVKAIVRKRQNLTEDEKKQLIDRLKECFDDAMDGEKTRFFDYFGF